MRTRVTDAWNADRLRCVTTAGSLVQGHVVGWWFPPVAVGQHDGSLIQDAKSLIRQLLKMNPKERCLSQRGVDEEEGGGWTGLSKGSYHTVSRKGFSLPESCKDCN